MNTENNKNNKSSSNKGIRTPQLTAVPKKLEPTEKTAQNSEYINPWISNIEPPPPTRTKRQQRLKKSSGRSIEKVYQNRTTLLNSIIIYATFLAALVVMGIMTILIPDKDISTRENRALAQFPKINSESILSGKTSGDLDSWYSDQFPGRDSLVTMWKKVDGALSLQFTEDEITIVEGSSDMGQGVLDPDDPEDLTNPLYTSPFFGGEGGENPNP